MKNGIKYLVAGLVATGLVVSSSYATITVGWQTAQNAFITDNTGSLNYLSGDLVEVGAFSSPPVQGSSSLANFTVFGTVLTGTGAGAGGFGGSKTASDTAPVVFTHTQIYLVAFNNATGIGATQEGIFSVDDTVTATWKFPATADNPNSTAIDLQDLFSTSTSGTAHAGAHAWFGSLGVDTSGPFDIAKLQLVPEPSTWMLVGTGLIGLLGLRRRRS